MNSKERLRHETLKLIDQCVELEAFAKVTREQAERALEALRADVKPLSSHSCAYELIRLATSCQLSAARFDYVLQIAGTDYVF